MYCRWPLAPAVGYSRVLRKVDGGRKVPDDDNSFLPGLARAVKLVKHMKGAFAGTFCRTHIQLHSNGRSPFTACRDFQSGQRFALKQSAARDRKQACPETGSTL